jgi:hypothetical protein
MTVRNRAWRRKKSRLILEKVKASKDWVVRQFSRTQTKEHNKQFGKPNRAPALRERWATRQELRDGFAEA